MLLSQLRIMAFVFHFILSLKHRILRIFKYRILMILWLYFVHIYVYILLLSIISISLYNITCDFLDYALVLIVVSQLLIGQSSRKEAVGDSGLFVVFITNLSMGFFVWLRSPVL